MLFALVDCNNFYASCELVFSPLLAHKPLVILSNNDGCVIARSQKAKDLGIPMGAPIYQYRPLIESGHLQVLSSNFTLYGDMSRRVMETIKTFGLEMEIYSIDEAFLAVFLSQDESCVLAKTIKDRVQKWTGIPVSIGLAKTKTLAKLANSIAKKDRSTQGVFILDDPLVIKELLSQTPVEKIWGIGSRFARRLAQKRIFTALQLRDLPDDFLRNYFPLPLLQTVYELREIPCGQVEESIESKKSITCSRSFSPKVESFEDLISAVACFASTVGEKLRKNHLLAHYLTVFLSSDSSSPDFEVAHLAFESPTAFTPTLITYATTLAEHLYQKGASYKRAGVLLTELILAKNYLGDLFSSPKQELKEKKVMEIVDKINRENKSRCIHFGTEKLSTQWKFIPQNKTHHFTTKWKDLLNVL